MTDPTQTQRLDELEIALRDAPNNLTLLGDAFDAALQAGELERAEKHLLQSAQLQGHDALRRWQLREAHWLIAKQRWNDAESVLLDLLATPGIPADQRFSLAHDLAYVAMGRGDLAAGLALLRPWVEAVPFNVNLDAAHQLLWMRLLNQSRRVDEALAWAAARWQAKKLAPGAAGVASMMAMDAGQGTPSLVWADYALRHESRQPEALLARGTLALGQNDAAQSRSLLSRALERSPNDGRVLAALGFTELHELQFDAARSVFERATQVMPGQMGAWHGLGWTLLLQGDFSAALQAFDSALALNGNFAESHGGLAAALASLDRRAEAEQAVGRSLQLDPDSVAGNYAQAVLRGEGRNPQTIRDLSVRLHADQSVGGNLLDIIGRAIPLMTVNR